MDLLKAMSGLSLLAMIERELSLISVVFQLGRLRVVITPAIIKRFAPFAFKPAGRV
jgi:hypothetical protein